LSAAEGHDALIVWTRSSGIASPRLSEVAGDDLDEESWFRGYPAPEITPSEFEQWVVEVFESAAPGLDSLRVTLHEAIRGIDGSYDFDATIRYRWAGMDFLVLVEAKAHKSPIKRELVQVLHSKVLSVGAHKGVMISTAPFQRGALEFAKVHRIALVSVTEGRFTYEVRASAPIPPITREEALRQFDLPAFVGHSYALGEKPDVTELTLIWTHDPEPIRELLLAVPPESDRES
jgi:hypothetical protein